MSTNDKNRFRKTYSFFRQQPIFASGGGGGGGGGGSGDQFWHSTTNDSIYTTGSVIIRGDETGLDSPFDVGSDVFFYVSGSIDAINPNDSKVAVFGGDLVVSGAFLLESDYLEITGTLVVTEGVSGSITKLADGTSYLIAGSNITITSQSNGSILISSTGGGGSSINFFDSTTAGSVYTTGSFAFRGQELIDSPSDIGTDVFFYVSGSTGVVSNEKSLFGGDLVVSGSFIALADTMEITGTLIVTQGISGSLTTLSDGTSYIKTVSPSTIDVTTASNGSVELYVPIGGVNRSVQFNDNGAFGASTGFSYENTPSEFLKVSAGAWFGRLHTTPGYYAFVQGLSNNASADFSHAEGEGTEAVGFYSHAEGRYTIASGSHQLVVGKFNLRNNPDSIFVIGNGTGTTDDLRSDIVRVESNNVQISGSIIQRNSGSSTIGFMGNDVGSASSKGSDVFFFVSGSTGAVSNQKSLFGGDVVVSGSFFAEGNRLEMTGTILATSGFSGSLTKLTDGTSYLVAGNNVNIVSQSNGSIVISSTSGGGDSFFSSTTAGSIYTTGSAAFRGQESIDSPIDKGTDVFFYVSGSKGSRDTSVAGSSLFGGDVIVSGSTYMLSGAIVQNGLRVTGSLDVEGDIVDISGSLIVTGSTYLSGTLFLTGSMFSEMGSITAVQGFSGSLTKLADGTSYLVAGNNVNIVSQSNGSIVISSTGGSSTVNLQFLAGTVSSAAPSGSMESIGMDYLNLSALPPVPTNYTFSAILATTAGTTAYMDLYDYNGIFSGGSPGPISGSVLTGSSQSYTYLTANLTAAMSSPSGNGIIEARIWCDPTGSNLNAICKSARLTIS